jgi:alanyl-tRNA synthetase
MGLERITAILQGVDDNYATDLFIPLIAKIKALTGSLAADPASLKVIADHSRAMTNLIADGVIPENAGRGYVLRRLIRRAVRHGKLIGIDHPFLTELADTVIGQLGQVCPQLTEKKKFIEQVIKTEELNFLATLQQGVELLKKVIGQQAGQKAIKGEVAFQLHDTYGFPIELTQEIAAEAGCSVDLTGFEEQMAEQRERARKAGLASDKQALPKTELPPTRFVGYDKLAEETKILALLPEGKYVVLEKSPFYGESGGQVGDTGIITLGHEESIRVVDTRIDQRGVIFHRVDQPDNLQANDKVRATVDSSKRSATAVHHTATHLLHQALREVLGEHVKQAGSYVGPDKLRFDFAHFSSLAPAEIDQVEQLVNQKIKEKLKVEVLQKSYPEALKLGAIALFGEKYGETVRVLRIGHYSLELCGGTHVKSTGEILFFKITSEGALGAGVRRIEAVGGQAAKIAVIYRAKALRDQVEKMIARYRELQLEKESLGGGKFLETGIFEVEVTELDRLGKCVDNHDSLNVNKFLEHLEGRVDWLSERIAKVEKELADLRLKQAARGAVGCLQEIQELNGIKVLLKELKGQEMAALRAISDEVQRQQPSVILLFSSSQAKVIYLVTIAPQYVQAGLSAKKIAATLSPFIQGKGGGKDDKAEGGGREVAGIPEAIEAVKQLINAHTGN